MKDEKIDLSKLEIPKVDLSKMNMPKVDIPKVDFSKILDRPIINPLSDLVNKHNEEMKAMLNEIGVKNALKDQREIDNHEHLSKIAENTQGIKDIVELVRQGNEINQQTFELFQELQKIMIAESKEEGEEILRNVLDKANQAKEDIDTIQTIVGYGKMLLTLVSTMM